MEFNTNMTVTNGNVTADEIAAMQSQIAELTTQLAQRQNVVDTLSTRIESVRVQRDNAEADFKQLNTYLNEYADGKGYCGEYEKQLDEWNEGFDSMKLEGRIREFQVECEVSFRYTTTITVEAANADDAREQVEQMSASEVMEDGPWDSPDYEEFEIGSIEVA
jgi:peptidoglycan hydrolase CwlO-like protein